VRIGAICWRDGFDVANRKNGMTIDRHDIDF